MQPHFLCINVVIVPVLYCCSLGGDYRPSRERSAALNLTVVIVLVLVVMIVFLAVVDVSCYFMNSCGVTMFVCVHVCGQQPHTTLHTDHAAAEQLER